MSQPGPNTVVVRALGLQVALQASGDDLFEAMAEAWSGAAVDDPDTPDLTVRVGVGSGSEVNGPTVAAALRHLGPTVIRRALDHRAGQVVLLHGTALADPDTGATVVLVAPSGGGRTTAALELGRHLAYLSDEAVAVTEEGEVLGFRQPLTSPRRHQTEQPPASPGALGLLDPPDTTRLAALVVLRRDPDHQGKPEVWQLDTIDSLAALAPESPSLSRIDRPLHRLAALVRQVGGAHEVTYGEAASLGPVLDDLIGGSR